MKRALTVLLASILLAACAGSKPAHEAPRPTANDPSCPVAVPGTSVSVEDETSGASLVFVTTGDVAELRRRVAAMAKTHNDHHEAMGPLPEARHDHGAHAGHDTSAHAGHEASGHAGHDMAGHAGHAGGMIGVHSKASSSDIEGGVKLSFVSAAADTAKLQSELRMHAQHLAAGTCAMGKS